MDKIKKKNNCQLLLDSNYLGNILDFYGFYGYDKFLHFSSGVLLYIIGDIILSKYIKDEYRLVRYVVPVFFSISFAGIWEIWEYSTDSILNFKSQGGLDDTMWDIICGSIGAMITFFIFYCKFIALKRRKI